MKGTIPDPVNIYSRNFFCLESITTSALKRINTPSQLQHSKESILQYLSQKNLYLCRLIYKMISVKKIIKLARKWQKMAALRRKRITLPRTVKSKDDTNSCTPSQVVEKGHFVVYSIDQKRLLLPLECLENEVVRELFNMAEEEFGLSSKGPLRLPCEAELIEYLIALIKQNISRDIERVLLTSIASSCCLSPFHLQHQLTSHQLPICSF